VILSTLKPEAMILLGEVIKNYRRGCYTPRAILNFYPGQTGVEYFVFFSGAFSNLHDKIL